MAEHIIDAFIVSFGIDNTGFREGLREIETGQKRLREQSKKTFDYMEDAGKKTGMAIKGLSREVIGLGLAFMGTRSIVGFMANMANGAATADRFGRTLGMSIQQVWAWRRAMRGFGGQPGDADSALQAIQNAKIGFRTGGLDTSQHALFARLGISGNDLQTKDAGSILQKLAGSRLATSDPQLYSNMLQQIGLSSPMIALLMEGKGSVDVLIKTYQANADGMEEAAKQSEKLQQEMAELTAQYEKAMVPILTAMLPVLQVISGALVKMTGTAESTQDMLGGAAVGAAGGFALGGPLGAALGAIVGGVDGWGIGSVLRGNGRNILPGKEHGEVRIELPPSRAVAGGRTRADRNNNPGNISDGAFARAQPGYVGSDGRFARFATPEHGFAAQERLLGTYMRNGRDTLAGIVSKYAPANENNVEAYVSHLERLMGVSRHHHLSPLQIPALARAMAQHEGYSGARQRFGSMINMHRSFARHSAPRTNVSIGPITIHTKATDARGIARDLGDNLRRRMAVAQSDPIVNP